MNELEFSETNWKALTGRGYKVKDDISSGVAGSESMALSLLKLDVSISIHYCSTSFKDSVQLRKRIMRRAKNVARPGDILTEEGTLIKGVVECREFEKVRELILRFGVPEKLVYVDREKKRIEVAPWLLEKVASKLQAPCFIVEEYPTADRLEVERRRLR